MLFDTPVKQVFNNRGCYYVKLDQEYTFSDSDSFKSFQLELICGISANTLDWFKKNLSVDDITKKFVFEDSIIKVICKGVRIFSNQVVMDISEVEENFFEEEIVEPVVSETVVISEQIVSEPVAVVSEPVIAEQKDPEPVTEPVTEPATEPETLTIETKEEVVAEPEQETDQFDTDKIKQQIHQLVDNEKYTQSIKLIKILQALK